MKEEPSDELIGLESHDLLFIPVGIVPPAEGDIAVLGGDNGDRPRLIKGELGGGDVALIFDVPALIQKVASRESMIGAGGRQADASATDMAVAA